MSPTKIRHISIYTFTSRPIFDHMHSVFRHVHVSLYANVSQRRERAKISVWSSCAHGAHIKKWHNRKVVILTSSKMPSPYLSDFDKTFHKISSARSLIFLWFLDVLAPLPILFALQLWYRIYVSLLYLYENFDVQIKAQNVFAVLKLLAGNFTT